MTRQSLWPSYEHSDSEQKNEKVNNLRKTIVKKSNFRGRGKQKQGEKKGETLFAVARYILDNGLDKKRISAELGISIRAVEINIKNIKEKRSVGVVINGLSSSEEVKLIAVLEESKRKKHFTSWNKKEYKASWQRIVGIMREHVAWRMFNGGCGVSEVARITGLRMLEVREVIENITGCVMEDLAREMFRERIGVAEIARRLGMAQKDVKKALPRVVGVTGVYKPPTSEVRRISTIKPGSPKSQRKLKKRPAAISRTGLAHWCMQHYDSQGVLKLPQGCAAPGDLPRRYPQEKVELTNAEPRPSFFPAPPLSLAEGTARGRRRMGYARLH